MSKQLEVVAWRTRYIAEHGMIGGYPWAYVEQGRRLGYRPQYETESLVRQSEALAIIEEQAREVERLREKADTYRRTLEIIGVGDSSDPIRDAAETLVECGDWRREAVDAKLHLPAAPTSTPSAASPGTGTTP